MHLIFPHRRRRPRPQPRLSAPCLEELEPRWVPAVVSPTKVALSQGRTLYMLTQVSNSTQFSNPGKAPNASASVLGAAQLSLVMNNPAEAALANALSAANPFERGLLASNIDAAKKNVQDWLYRTSPWVVEGGGGGQTNETPPSWLPRLPRSAVPNLSPAGAAEEQEVQAGLEEVPQSSPGY